MDETIVFYFCYEATPLPANAEHGHVAGAFVCCWVVRDQFSIAEEFAQSFIRDHGWLIVNFENSMVVERDYYEDNPDNLAYFEQAIVDGEVFVFHTYPIEDEEKPE